MLLHDKVESRGIVDCLSNGRADLVVKVFLDGNGEELPFNLVDDLSPTNLLSTNVETLIIDFLFSQECQFAEAQLHLLAPDLLLF